MSTRCTRTCPRLGRNDAAGGVDGESRSRLLPLAPGAPTISQQIRSSGVPFAPVADTGAFLVEAVMLARLHAPQGISRPDRRGVGGVDRRRDRAVWRDRALRVMVLYQRPWPPSAAACSVRPLCCRRIGWRRRRAWVLGSQADRARQAAEIDVPMAGPTGGRRCSEPAQPVHSVGIDLRAKSGGIRRASRCE
jgi:hypothetical protein